MVDKSPAEDKLLQRQMRVWEPKEHRPTLTWTRSGYKPYSTYVCWSWSCNMMLTLGQDEEQVCCLDTRRQGASVDAGIFPLSSTVYIKNESKACETDNDACDYMC
jgi:hypothetical protein